MESDITVKASSKKMDAFFDRNDVCSVRYFKRIKAGTYQVRVRHAELEKHLSGTFTIPEIIKKLSEKETEYNQNLKSLKENQ